MREPHPAPSPAQRETNGRDDAANDHAFRVVDAGWWLGTWEVCQAGPAWQLRSARDAGWVDFHGGNEQPLQLSEDHALALAAALNRRAASMRARLGKRSTEAQH